jgi:hypothetical protein
MGRSELRLAAGASALGVENSIYTHALEFSNNEAAAPGGLLLLLVGVPVLAQFIELLTVEDKELAYQLAELLVLVEAAHLLVKILVIEDVKAQLSGAVFG